MLSRDQILGQDRLEREEVAIPEWNDTVQVRALTASERDRFESMSAKGTLTDPRARMAVATLCDAEGKSLFAEADLPAVSGLSASALDRVFDVAMRLSRMGPEAAEVEKKDS